MSRGRPIRASAGWLAATAAAAGLLAFAFVRTVTAPAGPPPAGGFESARRQSRYVTSRSCRTCHADHHRSWTRTFHRTMTQDAGTKSVRAPFDGRPLDFLGVRTVPIREDGSYFLVTSHPRTGERTKFPIVRTVGSRRMQQYVTRVGDRHLRLPVAYSMTEERWFHLSEAFFFPDGQPFHGHTAMWEGNCIFCHNVRGNPGFSPPDSFDAKVEELGIACEACHGPGALHASRMRSPLRRYAFQATGDADPSIVNPSRLEAARSVQVCGHCHGVTVPAVEERIQEIFRLGDPYVPGTDLDAIYRPISRETKVGELSFAPRFWDDGSPRLTAYEYQGLLRSACHTKGGMTCGDCHAMHAGDPHGQLRSDRPGDAMCLGCHAQYAGADLPRHTGHPPDSSGSRCVACHMPDVVYGIMAWHPTHEIASPDPSHSARFEKPDACTVCHAGRSLAWAEREADRLWPRRRATRHPLSARHDAPEIPRALFAGEAIYRTLAAHRLGFAAPEREVAALAVPLLAEALLDPYPVVRRTARNSLARLSGMADLPHAHDTLQTRAHVRDAIQAVEVPPSMLRAGFPFRPDGRVDRAALLRWSNGRRENPFSFGE